MRGKQAVARCIGVLFASALMSASAFAQGATAQRTQADYENVLGWGRSIATILNSGKCISFSDARRIQDQYQDALEVLEADVRKLTGFRYVEGANVLDLSGWPLKVARENQQYDEYMGLLSQRICTPSGVALQIVFPKVLTDLGIEETRDATGAVTNSFKKKKDPLGAGLGVSYTFDPWNNSMRLVPFASIEYFRQTINQTFANGSFLGTTTNWIGNVGAKLGVFAAPGVFIYGLAGASFLNENMNINFGGPVTSTNTTIPGATIGLGGEYQPAFLQGFGRPVSVFLQYQHVWWRDAHLNTPAASPLFNYTFRREDDLVRFGLNIYFGDPAPSVAPARPLITK